MEDARQVAGCAVVMQDGEARRSHQQRPFVEVAVCVVEDLDGGLTRQAQDLVDLHARLMHEANGGEGAACVLGVLFVLCVRGVLCVGGGGMACADGRYEWRSSE